MTFTGVIQAVDAVKASYRIAFDKPGLGSQSVPDYEVRGKLCVELS